jgi:flagellar basal-body rod protein FlgC
MQADNGLQSLCLVTRRKAQAPSPEFEGGAMDVSLNATLSALQAHNRKMEVTANNVANVNTNGFKRDRAIFQESPAGGVSVKIHKDHTPAPLDPLAPEHPDIPSELSNVDLTSEISSMIPTDVGYKANLTVIKTRDEMVGRLLDTLA